VAMAMCVTGLVGISFNLSRKMTLYVARLLGGGGA
jgi:hypothetical protein